MTPADFDRLRALSADMLAKESLIRRNVYGNERAIATLVKSWANELDALCASAAAGSPPQQFSENDRTVLNAICDQFSQGDFEGLNLPGVARLIRKAMAALVSGAEETPTP